MQEAMRDRLVRILSRVRRVGHACHYLTPHEQRLLVAMLVLLLLGIWTKLWHVAAEARQARDGQRKDAETCEQAG